MLNTHFTCSYNVNTCHYCYKKVMDKVQKLICAYENKSKYTVHMCLLQQAWKHDLILKKVQKVIHFKQSHLLKLYINFKLRPASNYNFEKELFKLMKSLTFRKTYSKQEKLERYVTCY